MIYKHNHKPSTWALLDDSLSVGATEEEKMVPCL